MNDEFQRVNGAGGRELARIQAERFDVDQAGIEIGVGFLGKGGWILPPKERSRFSTVNPACGGSEVREMRRSEYRFPSLR